MDRIKFPGEQSLYSIGKVGNQKLANKLIIQFHGARESLNNKSGQKERKIGGSWW